LDLQKNLFYALRNGSAVLEQGKLVSSKKLATGDETRMRSKQEICVLCGGLIGGPRKHLNRSVFSAALDLSRVAQPNSFFSLYREA